MEDCERKYKEAFNMAVLEHKSDNEAVRESIERIFPQLKESEDEKIRKELISYFKQFDNEELRGVNISDWITWLEKQGKHANFRNKIQIGDHVTRNDNGELVNLSQLKRVAVKENKGNYGGISPNSEWSEEDEEMIDNIIDYMMPMPIFFESTKGKSGKEYTQEFISEAIKWLESLKPQPKQEWSEKDKGNLLDVKCIIDEVWHNQDVREKIDHSGEELESLWHWLDNIWQRVEYPQNTWKPTKDQIDALFAAVYLKALRNALEKDSVKQLEELYNQLKKLKE